MGSSRVGRGPGRKRLPVQDRRRRRRRHGIRSSASDVGSDGGSAELSGPPREEACSRENRRILFVDWIVQYEFDGLIAPGCNGSTAVESQPLLRKQRHAGPKGFHKVDSASVSTMLSDDWEHPIRACVPMASAQRPSIHLSAGGCRIPWPSREGQSKSEQFRHASRAGQVLWSISQTIAPAEDSEPPRCCAHSERRTRLRWRSARLSVRPGRRWRKRLHRATTRLLRLNLLVPFVRSHRPIPPAQADAGDRAGAS